MFSKCESCHCCEIGSGRQTLIITLLKKDDMRKRGLKLSEMILIVLDRRQMVRWITFEWPTSATVVLPRALSVHPHWQQHAYVSSRQTQHYAAFQYLILFQVLKYYLQQSALALLCRIDLELVKQDLQFKHSQFPHPSCF